MTCWAWKRRRQGPQVLEWERELNALVYELYGLTEEEIGVVEGLDHGNTERRRARNGRFRVSVVSVLP